MKIVRTTSPELAHMADDKRKFVRAVMILQRLKPLAWSGREDFKAYRP